MYRTQKRTNRKPKRTGLLIEITELVQNTTHSSGGESEP